MRIFSFFVLILLPINQAFVRPTRYTAANHLSFRTEGSLLSMGSSNEGQGGSHTNQKSLMDLLLPSNDCKVDQMSGTDLGTNVDGRCELERGLWASYHLTFLETFLIAYIGDVVFELFVRSRNVWPSKRTSDLQNIVVNMVRGR